jgi:hypothetical protein
MKITEVAKRHSRPARSGVKGRVLRCPDGRPDEVFAYRGESLAELPQRPVRTDRDVIAKAGEPQGRNRARTGNTDVVALLDDARSPRE